jgi:hypothetical protein
VRWYSRSSASNKKTFTYMKMVELVAAAAIPVVAGLMAPVWLTGGLGAAVVVLEGIQQLGQYQANWISYRSTSEALKHEKYLYLSGAGPYHLARSPERLLAERVEALVSQEHAKWSATREDAAREHAKAGS